VRILMQVRFLLAAPKLWNYPYLLN